ncbi:MAG TPA: GNAT family N-acetyltransferase, partial [Povalibacter sp.]|nr:GNAT family N-acetyltransferase [Povalibacter sp.]
AEVVRRYDPGLSIVTFDSAFRDEFRRLNVAWLERYFRVEPIDERVLGNPEDEILAPGGEVLFALLGGEVVGTVGLKVEDEDSFELTKMAVDERWLGRGFGQCLLESALELSRTRGKRRVVLYTQTSLAPAVTLYRKNGFVEMRGPLGDRYARCNLKMEKILQEQPVLRPVVVPGR